MNRAQTLADRITAGITTEADLREIRGILESFARIEAAVLPESVGAIVERHDFVEGCSGRTRNSQEHKDRSVLLDAVRALTTERDELKAYAAESQRIYAAEVNRQVSLKVDAQNDRDAARAEVATLKERLHAADNHIAQLKRDYDHCREVECGHYIAERDMARAEVERLKALVVEFKNASMLEVNGDPDGVTPAQVEANMHRYDREVTDLTERLRMAQHGEREALKMMGAEKERADRAETELAAAEAILAEDLDT